MIDTTASARLTSSNVSKRLRRTQAERRAASERRIIEAAIRVIGKKGTARLTLAEVGIEAGYSRGLPTHLFGSKERLLLRVVDSFINLRSQFVLPDWEKAKGLKVLRTTIHRWAEVGQAHPEYFRTFQILTGEAACEKSVDISADLRLHIHQLNRLVRERIHHFLKQARAEACIAANVDPGYTALVIVSTLRGLIAQWVLDPESIDLAAVTDRYMADVIKRLQPALGQKRKC
jgi:AcrR family transcriptional regulator